MKVLIIEDELEAAKNIKWLLQNTAPESTVLETIETVSEGIEWLTKNPHPDLIISDIQLADGISFDIYRQVSVKCPVIFTTAFDEYAIQSFKVHSIDYLLKPITEDGFKAAIEKYKSLNNNTLHQFSDKLNDFINTQKNATPLSYRKSFLVRYRDKMLPIKTEDFAFFYTKDSLVYGVTKDDKTYNIENTLEELEEKLDPSVFFRANRQFIVSRDVLKEIEFYFNGRLSLKTQPTAFDKILVSKERVPVFRKWFEVV
jgi:two-component system, LytTR family, response regulator LytT